MRIVLTGGGTGGHIYPAISVAQALREAAPDAELLFVGSSHGPEGRLAREAGIEFRSVPSSPLTRALSVRNAAPLARLVAGVLRARRILNQFRSDVALGTGGYTSAAVLVAQRTRRGPIAIHEQNVVPGRTNLWLARIADRVCVSFEETLAYFPTPKAVLTGMPVRREFLSLPNCASARRELGLRDDLFTVLVIGGSQGARSLNELVLGAWPLLDDCATQVLHQAGERNVKELQARAMPGRERYALVGYVNTPAAMAAADLIVSRSGAGTVSEIAAAGLPAILVPYPHHADKHQKRNAELLVWRGAAVLMQESEADPGKLADTVARLRSDREKLSSMAAASKSLAMPDAAKNVAHVVLSLAGAGL